MIIWHDTTRALRVCHGGHIFIGPPIRLACVSMGVSRSKQGVGAEATVAALLADMKVCKEALLRHVAAARQVQASAEAALGLDGASSLEAARWRLSVLVQAKRPTVDMAEALATRVGRLQEDARVQSEVRRHVAGKMMHVGTLVRELEISCLSVMLPALDADGRDECVATAMASRELILEFERGLGLAREEAVRLSTQAS